MVNLQAPLAKYPIIPSPLTLLVLGFLCLFSFVSAFAQDDLNIHGVVSDAMSSAKIAGVEVTVTKDGKQVDKYSTRANGKYEFYLSCGFHYVFYFEKEGYVKRSIEIDSRNIPPEVIGAGIIMPTDMSMFAITPAMQGEDLTVFDKPIGKASYDAGQADLIWDFSYTQKVKGEINTFIRNLNKKKKEESPEDAAKAAAEAQFTELVKAGDAAMAKENYDEAVEKYRAALDIKAEEQNVKGKLGEAETKRNQKREAEKVQKDYDDAIAAADAAFKSENFDQAIAKYEEALTAKPAEAYPKKQIDEVKRIKQDKAAELAKKDEYQKHMAEGDKAVGSETYDKAVAAYEMALSVIPGDKEAQNRRDAAQKSLKEKQDNAARDAEYAALISKADQYFTAEKFEQAKEQYQLALGVKSNDSYAKERVEACANKISELAQAEARQKEFDQIVAQGDAALGKQDYPAAITGFESALAIFADKADVKAKLEQARSLKDEKEALKKQKEQYDKLVADADKAFGKAQYEEARELYTQARETKSDETYPMDQLAKIKTILDAQAAEAAALAAYHDAMNAGRASLEAQKFDAAISAFDDALKAVSNDKAAAAEKEKATKLKAEFEAQIAADKAYSDAVSAADKMRDADKLQEAIEAYKAAQKLKPEEAYPKQQVEAIEATLAKRAAEAEEAARQAALQEQFDLAMAAGDKAMTAENYSEAINHFEAALGIFADNASAASRKKEAEDKLAEKQAAKVLDEQYNDAISRADGLLAKENYDDARKGFEEAGKLKPAETYPPEKIALIDEKLAALAAAAAEAERKAKTEQVNALVLSGDQLVGKNDHDGGISKYQEALNILPERTDILKKIADAEAAQLAWLEAQASDEAYSGVIKKADEAFAKKDWDTARRNYKQASEVKQAEKYPKDQLTLIEKLEKEEAEAELKSKNAQVDALLTAGEGLVAKNQFDKGIDKYSEALVILAERTDILKKIADAEAAQLAWLEAQASDEAYSGVIKKADEAFAKKDWDTARRNYKQASEVKQAEPYPKDQLALIDKLEKETADADLKAKNAQVDALLGAGDGLVAKNQFDKGIDKYSEALVILAERTDIRKKIADAEAAQLAWLEAQATDGAYDEWVAKADIAFAKSEWEPARNAYQQAAGIKPTEKYPKDQLALIDQKEKAASDAEKQALKAKIDALEREGDKALSSKDYEGAILKYESALDLDPARSDIEAKVTDAQNKMRTLMDAAANDAAYTEAVMDGDKAFSKQNWDEALGFFEQALGIKPNEKYPQTKIGEINDKLAAMSRESAEKDALERQKEFDALVAEGDGLFGKQKYDKSIEKYESALKVKPQSEIANAKIDAARKALNELNALSAGKQAYDDAVAQADEFFASQDYELAKMSYEDALALRPGEKHPTKRIGEINKILDKMLLQSEMDALATLEARYTEAIKRGDASMASKNYVKAIEAYEEAIEVKENEAYPKGQIERANLLIKDKTDQEARLAAEREAANRKKAKQDDEYRTVSTKSEEQAAAFMREALLAQEREKYERIKKQKAEGEERLLDWDEGAELRRMSSYAELLGYSDVSQRISDDGNKRYEERAKRSQGYKSTLLTNMQKQATIARISQHTAYDQIKKDAAAIRGIEYQRQSSNLEELREIARENRIFTEEYHKYYNERNVTMVDAGARRVQRETEAYHGQLEEQKALAEVKRSKNLEEAYEKMRGNAKEHTEYFRMALALEYPQGVTEESSTLGNKVIITRIVVKGSKGDEYRKVLDRAGNYYFKNGQSISELTWNRETLDAFYKKD